MSISVKLEWDTKQLEALKDRRIMGAIARAVRKAGSTALRDMRSEAVKRVRARKRLKVRIIKRALRMRTLGRGSDVSSMAWALDVSGKATRVSDYPHRQTKKGVSAGINVGKRTLIKSAFIATMTSGHKGVFVRRGMRRLPIDERFASRVSDALSHEGEAQAVLVRGVRTFGATFERLLPLELEKLAP